MLSTPAETFSEFGPSKYLRRTPPNGFDLSAIYCEVRAQLRADCPTAPGVYGMIDCGGRLVYVGMSRNLRDRTITYFQKDAHASFESARKESRVASRARRLIWEPAGHELLALLREQELIRRFAPEMNVRGRRRRRLVWVFLSVEDAPRFQVAAQLPKSCRHHWGPVVRTGGLLRAIELLNRHFHLPDCPPDIPMRFHDQHILFDLDLYPRCLRGEMNRCLAPCAGTITRGKYVAQLNRARAFLDGRSDSPLDELDREIKQAIDARNFEHAAILHGTRTELADLRDRLLPRPDLLPSSFVYAFERRGRTCWLVAHEGMVLKVGPAPNSERSRAIWHTRFQAWRDIKLPIVDEREGSELQIISSWFRRNSAELTHVMDFNSAQSTCETASGGR
jgi:excinuclease ABC subunit C